jgi:hypothetical protein
MSQEFNNAPRKDVTLLLVPEGLSRCPICDEYKGVMALGHLTGFSSSIYRFEDSSTPLTVQCICDGILCRTCNKNRIHRPISNTWDERGGFGHMPYFAAMMPCKDCRAKKKAKEDEERQARKAQSAVQNLDSDDSEER